MRDLGHPEVAVGRGSAGEPCWPADLVGAISHSGDIAIAIVGRKAEYAGLGVDIEQLGRGMSQAAARIVCLPNEMGWVDLASGSTRLTMLFSAKEAVFKATYPIERVRLWFTDAELAWRPNERTFDARLLKSIGTGYPVGHRLQVRCANTETQVLSATFCRSSPDRSEDS
jgi:4'-phosphopantetheinyl transferase EntD